MTPDFTAAPQTSVTGGMEHLHAILARLEAKLDLVAVDVSKLRDNLVPHLVQGRDYDFHPANEKPKS